MQRKWVNIVAGGCVRRGALLLEVLLALSVFVGAGLAVISILEQSTGAMIRQREQRQACDLAASAMARLEAGIDTPETLDGPVPEWDGLSDGSVITAGGTGSWEIDVKTEPSSIAGLVRVTVAASKLSASSSTGGVRAKYELTQLIRTPLLPSETAAPADVIGDIQRRSAPAEQSP